MLKQRLDACMETHPFYNLNEAIYETLCRSIIDLALAPGESLSETALAAELSVSRSPVRNALMRLQSDGLVTQSKGQSFQVAAIRREDCRELMEARIAIEGQAAFWAAERASAEHLKAMEASMKDYLRACREWNVGGMVDSDHRFHQEMINAAQNTVIAEIYAQISPRILHYRHFLFTQVPKETVAPIMAGSGKQLRAACDAIRLGFGGMARERIERDIAGMLDIVGHW
ncbi:MAG: GntR family transcriptional regulator [Oscillospiraceae bacterium]|nr:GntR family transcriptional regulator [Oscillospiraceae bacterium]MBQ6402591.1 GntR family transcriptional regulator [Oscillospiraceae bacterium]